jgi:hypothetical protein
VLKKSHAGSSEPSPEPWAARRLPPRPSTPPPPPLGPPPTHHDLVRVHDGGQPVRNDDGGAAGAHLGQAGLDLPLRQAVQRAGGLVQHQDGGLRGAGGGTRCWVRWREAAASGRVPARQPPWARPLAQPAPFRSAKQQQPPAATAAAAEPPPRLYGQPPRRAAPGLNPPHLLEHRTRKGHTLLLAAAES